MSLRQASIARMQTYNYQRDIVFSDSVFFYVVSCFDIHVSQ